MDGMGRIGIRLRLLKTLLNVCEYEYEYEDEDEYEDEYCMTLTWRGKRGVKTLPRADPLTLTG